MKVYIVSVGWIDEGGGVEAVFDSKEKAETHAEYYKVNNDFDPAYDYCEVD